MDSAEDVIIVGGGIAGLAAAIALRQRGVAALVLEQATELREIGAGLLLAPNACAVLERLGALPSLLSGHSLPVQKWELLDWKGRSLSALTIPKVGEFSISTRRCDLQWSLWPGREPRYCGYVGWRGLVDIVPNGWEGGRVSESWGRGRRFGIATVGDGRTYWYASANVPRSHCHERVTLAQLRRDFAQWHHPVTEILDAMPEEGLLQHPISDRRPSRHWQLKEKAVLLGDAAHSLTPNLGQGAAMALEDAWELAVQWGRPDAMARFEDRRRLRLQSLWALSRWLGVMIQWENPLLCQLRNAQMRAIPNALSTNMMRRFLRYLPGEAVDS